MGASFLGTAAFAGEQLQETLPAQQQEQKATPAPAAPAGDYAARESQAPATLAKFEGGDTVVVVGGTTLVIVLLVVLILVIL